MKKMFQTLKQKIEGMDGEEVSELESAFVSALHRAVLKALVNLKTQGVFERASYLMIWIPDSDEEIMDEAARALNTPKVYEEYAEEFQ